MTEIGFIAFRGALAIGLLAATSAPALAVPVVDRSGPSAVSTITREELEALPTGRRIEDLLRTCPVQTIPSVSQIPRGLTVVDGIPTRPSIDCLKPDDLRMIDIYNAHNAARAEFGSAPLVWDPYLARSAYGSARQMTVTGRVHSSREGRKDIRENLLQSLPGQRSPRQMVGVWISEQRYFTPGTFPNVSTTGNWSNVGHYTQIVWPTTVRLGCAIHSDKNYDWTVCHYSPPGNRDGTPIFAGRPFQISPMRNPLDEVLGGPIRPGDPGRLPIGGSGMTQIDPPAPPPPPPPTARDDAPEGKEENHPLVSYGNAAAERHKAAVDCGDKAAAEAEMAKMRYALDELRKRLKAAKKAGPYSTVKPDDVQKQIDDMQRKLREAEQPRPPGTCPPPPKASRGRRRNRAAASPALRHSRSAGV